MHLVPNKSLNGFTLLEVMLVIAIIGILATTAMPMYGNYTKRAKYSEVVAATTARKTAVSLCINENAGIDQCDGNPPNGMIPPDITSPGYGSVDSISTLNGTITATGSAEVDNLDYVLSPVLTGNKITWTVSGSCLAKKFCK